jgi:hypothetical protein
VILCWRPGERNIKKYRDPSEGISHTHILPRNGVTYERSEPQVISGQR